MNELQEKILALLVAKFQGVRKDGWQPLSVYRLQAKKKLTKS